MTNKTIAQALIKAQQFEEKDQYEQAYECYKCAHDIDKNDTEVLQKLATSAQMLQHDEEAIDYWKLYMTIKPEDPISYTQLLDLYFHENKYEYYMTRAKLKTLEGRLAQATDDYKKAINNTTDDKEIINARYLLAQTFQVINKPMQAIDEYLKILDHEHSEAVYLSLANLYYSEDKQAAIHTLNQAIEEYPENTQIKEMLCKIYLSTGDYEKAEKHATNSFDRIKSMLMQEKNDEAYGLLDNLSDIEKKQPQYYALMAEYYYNIGENEKTLEYIDNFEQKNQDSPLPSQMRALVYENLKNEYEAHLNWGKYYIKKNNMELALDEYLNAYNEKPDSIEIIKELINLYSALDDKFACAEFCEKLVAIEKDDTATLKRLIQFYEEQGYEDKVIDYLQQLADKNPRDYETLLKLAKHSQKNRRIDDAIAYYEKYIKAAPNSDEKEEAKVQLNRLTTGDAGEEEGFLDKIIGLFSKK